MHTDPQICGRQRSVCRSLYKHMNIKWHNIHWQLVKGMLAGIMNYLNWMITPQDVIYRTDIGIVSWIGCDVFNIQFRTFQIACGRFIYSICSFNTSTLHKSPINCTALSDRENEHTQGTLFLFSLFGALLATENLMLSPLAGNHPKCPSLLLALIHLLPPSQLLFLLNVSSSQDETWQWRYYTHMVLQCLNFRLVISATK